MAADDVYRTIREKVSGYTGAYADYVMLVPDLFLLVTRLMLDQRVEAKHKVYLGAAVAYVISPIDLLSERRFGPIGYLDDLVVIVAALNILLNESDQNVVLEHWAGKEDLLGTVRNIVAQADGLIGKGRLEKILQTIGIRRPAPGV
ncbi:MAG TPA: DUF1232 domain-containing protein [Vicinamibacterales bacterium]|nr:DUF1232 domain-containing protein [Vicinamibacterales bacterium]HOQ59364.1 DUF1232 domain-containing protein [Vicinamibacterales bacterium]HPK71048.1 DUF1232 domain-containing protein [Vicinamibacterales bacterium]